MKPKKVALFSVVACLMLILGYIFEIIIPFGFFGTYVSINPAEGLLIFLLIISGFKAAVFTFIVYATLLFTFKGLSPLLINEIALLISVATSLTVFNYIFKRKDFLTSAIWTIIIHSMIMLLVNSYFIVPSFIKQSWTTYKFAFPDTSFLKVMLHASLPLPLGSGILHGNILKYISCFTLASIASKKYAIK